ncbi:MAG: segregation/condensation protein A [Clostridia bacterium]
MSDIDGILNENLDGAVFATENQTGAVSATENQNGAVSATVVEPTAEESEILHIRPEVVYHLSDFEGSLDLLLTLIKDAKINIEDIFVSDVTKQYVEIIKNTPKEEFDFEYAGEFITLAAELVYLKSLRTLPQDEVDDMDPDDPEVQRGLFLQKIKEYALLREQSEKLKTLETTNRFCRQPVFSEKDFRVSLTNFSLPKLIDAFAHVLMTAEHTESEKIPKKVMRDRFSVHDQMERIRALIIERREMDFIDLFEPDYDKIDIITTFLSVLELMKYGVLHVTQEELFGKITLFAIDGVTETAPLDIPEDDDGKY